MSVVLSTYAWEQQAWIIEKWSKKQKKNANNNKWMWKELKHET